MRCLATSPSVGLCAGQEPSRSDQTKVFVLGAYPSALHVRWIPPKDKNPVQALAVDNEPECFWDGADEAERIALWKSSVCWTVEWGAIGVAQRFNGPSGRWVMDNVLNRFGISPSAAWLTDCLTTYRQSDGQSARIADTYETLAKSIGLPEVQLQPHPNEDEIVTEAQRSEKDRLLEELRTASPEVLATLGNAALRVMSELVSCEEPPPSRLSPGQTYGTPLQATLPEGSLVKWYALAHPAAPGPYQDRHKLWAPTP